MEITLQIPDEVAAQLGGEAVQNELERGPLGGFALEELRAGRITEAQLERYWGWPASKWMVFSRAMASIGTTRSKTSSGNGRPSKN